MGKTAPQIGFATELSTTRREAWSGTPAHMLEALRMTGQDVRVLGPISQGSTMALNRISWAANRLLGWDPMLNRTSALASFKARALERAIAVSGVDIVVAPASSALIARLPSGPAIAYVSDATARLLFGYYPSLARVPERVRQRVVALEASAMRRADLLIYPTHWAANSAVSDYGIDPSVVVVQPFGANLSDPPSREEALAQRAPGPIRLLFCGVDWRRKGGDTVLAALRALHAGGVDAELLILGCTPPPSEALSQSVKVIPFLNKRVPSERARFRQAFLDADVLILPTQAEAYGLVFCEAAAFGIVSVAAETGGVPEVVRHGETGFTIPHDGGPDAYAAAVRRLVEAPSLLDRMRRAAREDYERRLNWGAWAEVVLPRIKRLVGP